MFTFRRLLKVDSKENRETELTTPMPSRGSCDLYQPLDPFSSAFAPDAQRSLVQRSRPRCLNTDGRLFNFVVGCVIFTNAIFLCIEADLGLLGATPTQTSGLQQDMGLLGMEVPRSKQLRASLHDGLEADRAIRADIEKDINSTVHKDINLMGGAPTSKPAAYTVCEYFFVLFYILEIALRICDVGICGYWRDPWSGIDLLAATAGVLDLGLPFFLPRVASSEALNFLAFLRLMRVLRIIRFLRVCHELRIVSRAFASAFHALIWTGTLVLVVDLVCALLLTSLIGQKAHLWGDRANEIRDWFGSIGRSLQTLAAIATLSGWDDIAAALEEVLPRAVVAPSFVIYITLCTFTMACLVAGIVSDSFAVARAASEARRAREIQEHRATFAVALANMLSTCEQAKKGYLTNDEFKIALESQPAVLSKLRLLDIDSQVEELTQLFDRLAQDPTCDGAVRIETLAEAMTHLGAVAEASEVFDLRYSLQASRREGAERAERMRQDARAHSHELAGVAEAANKVSLARQEVAAVQEAVNALRKEVGSLGGRLQEIEAREERDKRENLSAFTAVSKKLDDLATQVNDQAVAAEKSSALNAQLVGQELAAKLSAELSQRLSEEISAQLTAAAAASQPPAAVQPNAVEAPESGNDCAMQGTLDNVVCAEPSDGEPSSSAYAPSSAEASGADGTEAPAAKEPHFEVLQREEPEAFAPEVVQEEPGPEAAAGPTTSRDRGASPDHTGKSRGAARPTDYSSMMDLGVDEMFKTMLSSRGSEPDASSGGL